MYIISNQDIIVVFSSAKTLQISYIGMQTQEVAIKPNLRVVLKSDAQLIDEVVVTGYGVTKKAAFTGSAQTVDNKDLMKKTDANFMKSLEGSVAGLQVNSLTGQPGAYASTTIRGVGSMNSGTELMVLPFTQTKWGLITKPEQGIWRQVRWLISILTTLSPSQF